ncbi:MAG: Ribosomal RNA small subunit methyltransferase A [Parcubacteria group bacterium ADurb.Bin326]|mgnify:CR=1 FL=1|nr:MAG: Ribosomal RNA small subunit methyltransferase A [Parcubacteria group bacterium ADurb.Bin326]
MEAKELCKKFGITPSKAKGQNFLIDGNIVNKIIKASNLKSNDVVLEVGPGLGVLTEKLLSSAGKVIAIELDRKASSMLKERFVKEIKSGKLSLVEEDVLRVNFPAIGLSDFEFKLVANLPYSITSKIFRLFLEVGPRPSEMVVMIQKKVARRIIAKPGDMSLLSLSVQLYSDPEVLFDVSPNCFWPAPEVDSSVVKLKLKKDINPADYKLVFRLARMGFASKRKQLHNNLSGGLGKDNEAIKKIISELGWNEKIRAQDLSVPDWVTLSKRIQELL